jgi:hypothetical protein
MRRQRAVIQRQRHVRVRLAPEHDHADAIGRPLAHELRMTLLAASSGWAQVGLLHRPRQIQRDDDVDAFQLEVVVRARALRPGRRHRHQHDHRQPQHGRQIAQPRHDAGRCAASSMARE